MAAGTRPTEAWAAEFAAVASLPAAVLVTKDRWEDGGVEIVFANQAFCQLTGYRTDELAGQNTRLLHGAKTDLAQLHHGRTGYQSSGEGWLCRKDGAPFFARWNFNPLQVPGGSAPGWLVAVYEDKSELARLREALLESRKLDTLGRLASGVAHDFNNLLSVINGYCEIMTGKLAALPGAQRDLDEIHRAGLKASAIAGQILEFSRRQETEIQAVNYNTLIREITEILRRVAGETVALELRLASDLGNVRIDPTQFQQVVLNLCFNAREAMPRGGQLSIRTHNFLASGREGDPVAGLHEGFYAVMRVTDTGLGIAPGVLQGIFEPFFTTKPLGTGLGLSTAAGIVRQHGGQIAVHSVPGEGTTFEVYLPETPEPERAPPARLVSLPLTKGSEAIVLIEKDDVLRKMIGGILATDGYTVTEAATPEAAAVALAAARRTPQLVLAHADNRETIALLHLLHTRNPDLRFISLSAAPPAAALPRMRRGAVVYLPKPFALSKLVLGVRTLLDQDLPA
jgi:PAS domain S-box-containing protein